MTFVRNCKMIVGLQHEAAPQRSKISVVEVLAPTLKVYLVTSQMEVVSRTSQIEKLLIEFLKDRVSVVVLRVQLAARGLPTEGIPRLLIDA